MQAAGLAHQLINHHSLCDKATMVVVFKSIIILWHSNSNYKSDTDRWDY